MVESIHELRSGLDKEKTAMTKLWASREQQITRSIEQLAGFYGDLQGLGAAIQKVDRLELEG